MNPGISFVIILSMLGIALFSYLLGSINFSLIISRLVFHMDIREKGSGNAGATNSLRVMGLKWTVPIALGDIAKGVTAILLGGMLLDVWGMLIAAVFSVLGHNFPIYFSFRGGKGVVNTAVAIGMIDWRVLLICLTLFLIAVLIWRYVSLGSLIGVFSMVPLMWLFHAGDWRYPIAGALLAALCAFMHRENIHRLLTHTERKFSLKRS